jgi:hypothetical protein
VAPGALPRTPNPPATAAERPQPAASERPLVMASVPMPQPAPQPKEGEAPPEHGATFGGLLGNLFAGNKAQVQPAGTESEGQALALRGTTQPAAKSKLAAAKPAATLRTASTPVTVHGKPHEATASKEALKPAVAAAREPERKPPVRQAETPQAPANELRTAYSAPAPSNEGLLSGAQPVVPVGSFDSRWSGLR